ncbi:hypothetical protein FQN57_007392 [Myotisia sp. PD_48]|nr:hypothetical protein FQN57_007392 [Myotisia sp. PD_48]
MGYISSYLAVMQALLLAALIAPTWAATPPAISTLYQFGNGSWLENIAAGPTHDSILVTRMDTPALYRINLPQNSRTNATAKLVAEFPDSTGLLGIQEYTPGAYAVIAASFNAMADQWAGFSVWSVQFSPTHKQEVSTRKIADIPGGQLPNGMTLLHRGSGTILISDVFRGLIYRVNVRTGAIDVVLEHETMKGPGGRGGGVNGIRTVTIDDKTYLFFANIAAKTLNKVQIDPLTAQAIGEYTTVILGYSADDFAYDTKKGDVYIAGFSDNVVVKVTKEGVVSVVAGSKNQLTVAGGTSAVFGKGRRHSRTLYVTTNGARNAPVNGTITEGAKVVALTVDKL